jgi:hypothetical protein
MIIIAGRLNAAINIFWIKVLPLNLKRDRIYAAGDAMIIMAVQLTTVYKTEFIKNTETLCVLQAFT